MTSKQIKQLRFAPLVPFYIRRLQYESSRATGVDDFLKIAWNTRLRSLHIRPLQQPAELRAFIFHLATVCPKRVLEIGTARGGTLYLFSQIAPGDAILMSIDLPGGAFGKGYPLWRAPLYRSFAHHTQKIQLVRGDSHDAGMLARVSSVFGNELLDFLFIDGDHEYEGVKKDFEMYSHRVKPGGIIAFHDIVPGRSKAVGGVPKFWLEIKSEYKHLEIVDNWDQGGFGIGILRCGERA